jgi:hypothetical protein
LAFTNRSHTHLDPTVTVPPHGGLTGRVPKSVKLGSIDKNASFTCGLEGTLSVPAWVWLCPCCWELAAGADRSVSLPARAVLVVPLLMKMPIANNRSNSGSHSRWRLLIPMFCLPCICSLLTS